MIVCVDGVNAPKLKSCGPVPTVSGMVNEWLSPPEASFALMVTL